jgi:AcrR family transcriptional regulator
VPTTVRKRKEQQRKQRTRQALLTAARRVFVRKGYFSTLISDIVEEAGVGQGTFYRYFSHKREVFEVLFDQLIEKGLALFAPMSEQPLTTLAQYRAASLAAARRGIAFLEEHRDLVLLFLREGPSVDSVFEARLRGVHGEFARLAQSYLDHAIEQGFARPCRSDVVSHALVGMVLRLVELYGGPELGELTDHELAREMVDFAFLGFGQP